MTASISKSRYLNGIQCQKLLWYQYNAKDQLPEHDAATEAVFNQGHQVGDLAKKLFPGGMEIDWDAGFKEGLQQTQELLKLRKPIFEAGFSASGTHARADVLDPARGGKWDIIEVKMGSSVKDPNWDDVAFQRYCYEAAGLTINRCHLMHINREYLRDGEIDPTGLFIQEDITEAIAPYSELIEPRLKVMHAAIAKKKCPDCDIGPQCSSPYACVLQDICWAKVWEAENSVFTLSNARGKEWELYKLGILRTDDIPADYNLSLAHRIQATVEKSGRPHIDEDALRNFFDQLEYPLYYMDFETFGFNMPIPVIDNMHPYDQIPFQFSVHVVESEGAKPVHHSWLQDGPGDPRSEFMKQLKKVMGKTGSVIVYNQGFESSRLRECAEFLPEYSSWVAKLCDRMIDLYAPFRSTAVYFPGQNGSRSIKAVLPAVTGSGYDGMAISDGGQASDQYLRITYGDVTAKERSSVRKHLDEYCGLDTHGMVDIVKVLTAKLLDVF